MSEQAPAGQLSIQYESTFPEALECHFRAVQRLKLLRRDERLSTVLVAVFSATPVFLIVPNLPGEHFAPLAEGLVAAAACVALATFIAPRIHRQTVRRRLRGVLRELRGSEQPISFQVDLAEEGTSAKLGGTRTTYEWASVKEVDGTPDTVDFLMKDGGFVSVSKRAFASTEAAQQFIQLAGQYLIRAQTAEAK